MRKRIISAVVGVIILIPILWFSDTYVLPIAVGLVCMIALGEMMKCIGVLKKWALSVPLIVIGGALPIIARVFDGHENEMGFIMLMAAVGCVTYIFAVSMFSHDSIPIDLAGLTFMTFFYITGGFTSIVLMRDFGDNNEGMYLYILIFIGAWITDIFAYFVGRLFGKHKLIPEISPKKTVEGSIGGIVFCALAFIGYGAVMIIFTKVSDKSFLALGIVGVIISVVAQIGDLTMSQIKRHFGIKDYGKIMPGHGGALDRFDSILAVSLTLVVACTVIGHFGLELLTL